LGLRRFQTDFVGGSVFGGAVCRARGGSVTEQGGDVWREAKELISQAVRVRVAVAFWAGGSFERLDAESVADAFEGFAPLS